MTTTTTHLTPAELDALLEAAKAATPELAIVARLGAAEYGLAQRNFLRIANPATITRLVLMVRELENKLQFVTNERNRLLQSSLTTEATQAMRIDELQSDLAEEKRLRAELKQIAQIGIAEVSSVGTALKDIAVHDAIEHFRARAVRALDRLYEVPTPHNVDISLGYSEGIEKAKQSIESLPLVETEGE